MICYDPKVYIGIVLVIIIWCSFKDIIGIIRATAYWKDKMFQTAQAQVYVGNKYMIWPLIKKFFKWILGFILLMYLI